MEGILHIMVSLCVPVTEKEENRNKAVTTNR
jgi:hypothetical protein